MREPDEIQDLFDLPILGYIPESGALRKPSGAPRLRGRASPSPEVESSKE